MLHDSILFRLVCPYSHPYSQSTFSDYTHPFLLTSRKNSRSTVLWTQKLKSLYWEWRAIQGILFWSLSRSRHSTACSPVSRTFFFLSVPWRFIHVSRFKAQCCFMFSETVWIIRDGKTRTATSTFTQLRSSDIHIVITTTKMYTAQNLDRRDYSKLMHARTCIHAGTCTRECIDYSQLNLLPI